MLRQKHLFDSHHIELRNAFGYADHQRYLGLDRLLNRFGGRRGRHVDHGRICAGSLDRITNTFEHWQIQVRLTSFVRRHTADHLRAVLDCLLRMERALLAGETLHDHFGGRADLEVRPRLSITSTIGQ